MVIYRRNHVPQFNSWENRSYKLMAQSNIISLELKRKINEEIGIKMNLIILAEPPSTRFWRIEIPRGFSEQFPLNDEITSLIVNKVQNRNRILRIRQSMIQYYTNSIRIVPGRNSWDEELIDNQPNNYGYFYQIDSNRPDINRSIRNRFLQTYQSGNEEQFVSFKLIVEYFPANLFDQM
ncbi:uncharacterized protein LOC113790166 [Dermatophagoides pteronyssinus]|uniref:Uncharacterized protein n=1 Tax=Dermatophagoides pteronyssinus TaxID=6956 RepID=A0ABQ8IU18_DERPT|nr:hypothetical protein DERP_014643 [Dermatophagoides pteronyssinus]